MVLNTIWHKPVWVRVPEGVQKCIFLSLTDAAEFVGLSSTSGIAKCCKGKRRSAGGYLWRYKE